MGATSMNIQNLTVTGPATGFPFRHSRAASCNVPLPGLFGIFFNGAGGSVNNVQVLNMFQQVLPLPNSGGPACTTGYGIRADSPTVPRTLKITDTEVSNYQRGGLFASGMVTMNVSAGSIIGPPSSIPFSVAQNGVSLTEGASGTITGNTLYGSDFGNPLAAVSTAVLLSGATNVTIDHNTITGEDTDLGIAVYSTNVTISFNAIGRTTTGLPSYGSGIYVDPPFEPTTRLICNTFSNWLINIENPANIDGPEQEPCPQADLALTKVVSNASPNVGDQVTFTVTLTSNGPDTATNVQVTDLLPAGLTFVSATPSQGTYDPATGQWIVGSVTTATPPTLQLVATIASTDAQTNTATISASDLPDPNTANNTATASVAPLTTTTTTTTSSTTTTTTPALLPPAPTPTFGPAGGALPATGSDGGSTLYLALGCSLSARW